MPCRPVVVWTHLGVRFLFFFALGSSVSVSRVMATLLTAASFVNPRIRRGLFAIEKKVSAFPRLKKKCPRFQSNPWREARISF